MINLSVFLENFLYKPIQLELLISSKVQSGRYFQGFCRLQVQMTPDSPSVVFDKAHSYLGTYNECRIHWERSQNGRIEFHFSVSYGFVKEKTDTKSLTVVLSMPFHEF